MNIQKQGEVSHLQQRFQEQKQKLWSVPGFEPSTICLTSAGLSDALPLAAMMSRWWPQLSHPGSH